MAVEQPRVRSGAVGAGRFASFVHAESGVSLEADVYADGPVTEETPVVVVNDNDDTNPFPVPGPQPNQSEIDDYLWSARPSPRPSLASSNRPDKERRGPSRARRLWGRFARSLGRLFDSYLSS